MARDLSGEQSALLAHAVLDESVADAVHERDPAGALDRVPDGPAGSDVVNDLRAGLLLEDGLGEKGRDEIARSELAGVVDEEAAIGVAVESDSELGPLLEHLGDDEVAVLREERVRLVV